MQHSANEQYFLELINAERKKAGVQPLAFDYDLSEAAAKHTSWMLATDTFSHTGAGGSSPTQRIQAAGYSLNGSWATGENIAWATTRAPTGYADEVRLLHTNLMNSAGHRANILNGNFREVGLGFEVGDYRGRSGAFVTENFGKSGSDVFLTGVAFDDKDGDRFYDPGEQLSGINVTARSSTGALFKTTTMTAGGYDLALKAGTYQITFSGAGIDPFSKTVTIGSKNVKLDLVDPAMSTLSAKAAAPVASAPDQTDDSPSSPIATHTDAIDVVDQGSGPGGAPGQTNVHGEMLAALKLAFANDLIDWHRSETDDGHARGRGDRHSWTDLLDWADEARDADQPSDGGHAAVDEVHELAGDLLAQLSERGGASDFDLAA